MLGLRLGSRNLAVATCRCLDLYYRSLNNDGSPHYTKNLQPQLYQTANIKWYLS